MLAEELRGWTRMVMQGQDADRPGLRSRSDEFERALAALQEGGRFLGGVVGTAPPAVRAELAAVASLWSELRPDLLAVAEEARHEARFVEAYQRAERRLPELRQLAHEFVTAYVRLRERQRRDMLRTLSLIAAGNLAVFLGGLLLTRRYIVRPILSVSTAARRIEAGDFSLRLDVSTRDELGTLACAFNRMTERVQGLLDALDLRRKHAETVVDSVPAWFLTLRRDLKVLRVNRSFRQALGLDQATVAGRHLADLVPAPGLIEAVLEALSSGVPKRGLRLRMPWEDGEKPLRVTIAGTRLAEEEEEEEEEEVLLVLEDLTEEERAEARFQDLLEAAPDAMIVSGRDGKVRLVNAQAERMLGYRRDELTGQSIEILVPDSARAVHVRRREGFYANPCSRAMGAGLEYYACRKDGTHVPVEISLSPLDTQEGPVVVSAIRDVSKRVQLELQLRQTQKLKAVGQLAGGVAHDFNNMLTVIVGASDMALMSLDSPADLQQCLLEIQDAAERSAVLTRQLLAFSRKQILEPRYLNLNEVAAGMDRMLRRVIPENIEVVTRLAPDLGSVFVDRVQIEQVLMNLAINARDAMPGGGRLTIETSNEELDQAELRAGSEVSPGPCVMLAVSDSGVGMNEETLSRVFEPFFTTKPAGEGTGLGLATVYGIVEQSGGRIWADSEPGRGTTFSICLPRAEEKVLEPEEETRSIAPQGSETILLVEDDEAIRNLVVRGLRAAGYTVIAAPNRDEALRLVAGRKEPVHILITDVVMPGMSGPGLASELRAVQPWLKVIYMSGYAVDLAVDDALLEPGTLFLQKPFSLNALKDMIREILERCP